MEQKWSFNAKIVKVLHFAGFEDYLQICRFRSRWRSCKHNHEGWSTAVTSIGIRQRDVKSWKAIRESRRADSIGPVQDGDPSLLQVLLFLNGLQSFHVALGLSCRFAADNHPTIIFRWLV